MSFHPVDHRWLAKQGIIQHGHGGAFRENVHDPEAASAYLALPPITTEQVGDCVEVSIEHADGKGHTERYSIPLLDRLGGAPTWSPE